MKAIQFPRRLLAVAAIAMAIAAGAPNAEAQSVGIGFKKHGKHGSIGIVIGSPVRHAPYCPPAPLWIPGHYQNVERRVFVPGRTRQEFVPAVYEDRYYRDYCGNLRLQRVLVTPACWRTVEDPGTWQCVTERVWVEGAWR